MAIIESLRDGIKVVELIARTRQPVTISWLIAECDPEKEEADPKMSEASIRNAIETLVSINWVAKYPGKGMALEYGLGEHAAKLWPIYLGRKLDMLERQQNETAAEIAKTRRMVEEL